METANNGTATLDPKLIEKLIEEKFKVTHSELINKLCGIYKYRAKRYGFTDQDQDKDDIGQGVQIAAVNILREIIIAGEIIPLKAEVKKIIRGIGRHFDNNFRMKVWTRKRNADGKKIYKNIPKNAFEVSEHIDTDTDENEDENAMTLFDVYSKNEFILAEKNAEDCKIKEFAFDEVTGKAKERRKNNLLGGITDRYEEILYVDTDKDKMKPLTEGVQIARAAYNSGIVNTNVVRAEHVAQLLGYQSKDGLLKRIKKEADGEELNPKYDLEPKPLISGTTNGHATLFDLHDTLCYRATLNDQEGFWTESEDSLTVLNFSGDAIDRKFRHVNFNKNLDISELKPQVQDTLTPDQELKYCHLYMSTLKQLNNERIYNRQKKIELAKDELGKNHPLIIKYEEMLNQYKETLSQYEEFLYTEAFSEYKEILSQCDSI